MIIDFKNCTVYLHTVLVVMVVSVRGGDVLREASSQDEGDLVYRASETIHASEKQPEMFRTPCSN